jgi:hypothetical protein
MLSSIATNVVTYPASEAGQNGCHGIMIKYPEPRAS